jgi:hypothetical protein
MHKRHGTGRSSSIPEALTPITVSQETSYAVLGIDARRYLTHLRSHPEIARSRIGRLVVSCVSAWTPGASPSGSHRDVKPWNVDEALAKAVSR